MQDQTYASEAMVKVIALGSSIGVGVMVGDLGKEIFYRIEGGDQSIIFLRFILLAW